MPSPTATRRLWLAPTAAVAILTGAGTGCAPRDLNARPTIGGAPQHDTLAERRPTADIRERTHSLDRSIWVAEVYVVPVDGTVHGPTYRSTRSDTDTARGHGLFPTTGTATALDRSPAADEIGNALLAPVGALGELLLMPVELVLAPPPSQSQSPGRVYKRTLQGGWSNAPAAGDTAHGITVEAAE